MRNALDLQRLIAEEVVACDHEVLVVHFDTVFDATQMDDIAGGEVAMAGPPVMVPGPPVLSNAELMRAYLRAGHRRKFRLSLK